MNYPIVDFSQASGGLLPDEGQCAMSRVVAFLPLCLLLG